MFTSGAVTYQVEKEIGGQRFLFQRSWSGQEKRQVVKCFKWQQKDKNFWGEGGWTYWGMFDTVKEATKEVEQRAKAGAFER